MRGNDGKQNELFSYISLESRVPRNHPLRKMREMVDEALEGMSGDFDEMYSRMGRPLYIWPNFGTNVYQRRNGSTQERKG